MNTWPILVSLADVFSIKLDESFLSQITKSLSKENPGVALLGPAPLEFIPPITSKEFIDNLKNHLPYRTKASKEASRHGYQSYIIMPLCRTLFAVEFGHHASKPESGEWAAKEYPQWADLIHRAWQWHGSLDCTMYLDSKAETEKFVELDITEAKTIKS